MSAYIKAEVLAVCSFGEFRCVLIRLEAGKTDMMQLLLCIILGSIIKPFPNNRKSIILHWERSFTHQKHSRQLPIFSKVVIPEKSPECWTVQSSWNGNNWWYLSCVIYVLLFITGSVYFGKNYSRFYYVLMLQRVNLLTITVQRNWINWLYI